MLVPRNTRGVEVINALKAKNIEYVEFLSSTSNTRAAAGALSNLISYLADPQSAPKLAKAYQVWRRDWKDVKERSTLIHDTSALAAESGECGGLRQSKFGVCSAGRSFALSLTLCCRGRGDMAEARSRKQCR